MRAIQVSKPGGPEAMNLVDLPMPVAKPGDVVVQIKAIGVNFIDVYFREGRYPAPLPAVLGQEASGVVTSVGDGVTNLAAGDRVAWAGTLGTYAEYATVAAERAIRIPDALGFDEAAAAMLQGMTAHYLCRATYPLQRGETALVHAAAGGVGLLLVQMAKRIGAQVIGTAGDEEKAQLARDAGADEVILYQQLSFKDETKRLTGGKGVHVVYDGVGKTTFLDDLEVLRPRGYLVLFGGSSGAVEPFDPIKLSQKGSLFLTRPTLAHYIATRAELELRAGEVLQSIVAGELKIRISGKYPLAEAGQAHRDLEGRKTTGKILLVP